MAHLALHMQKQNACIGLIPFNVPKGDTQLTYFGEQNSLHIKWPELYFVKWRIRRHKYLIKKKKNTINLIQQHKSIKVARATDAACPISLQ